MQQVQDLLWWYVIITGVTQTPDRLLLKYVLQLMVRLETPLTPVYQFKYLLILGLDNIFDVIWVAFFLHCYGPDYKDWQDKSNLSSTALYVSCVDIRPRHMKNDVTCRFGMF